MLVAGVGNWNLEGCCVDVVAEKSWKLMMVYLECEESNIYTALRLGTPAALNM